MDDDLISNLVSNNTVLAKSGYNPKNSTNSQVFRVIYLQNFNQPRNKCAAVKYQALI